MPRRSQAQDRLLTAVTDLAGDHGYSELTVERLLAAAGVSRATFYQYFSNVDDAFSTAYRLHAHDLLTAIAAAVRRAEQPEPAALQVLVDLALSRPRVARLLLSEGLAAGSVGLHERDALISAIQDAIAHTTAPCTIDLPAEILIGAAFRFLSIHLAGEPVDQPHEEVVRWAEAFAGSPSRENWSARFVPDLYDWSPSSQDRPRRRRPEGTPRERMLDATAASIHRSGYRATSVADIVAAARVSRRSFYNEFANKSEAFVAAYELGFQRTLAACAPAFFSSAHWPERVWDSALAFTRYFASAPSSAYLGFVECYALGREFEARVHQTQLAFTMFLEEGYRQRSDGDGLSRASSALTAAAIAEAGFLASRGAPSLYIRRMQPIGVYIVLTPFIGRDQAGPFVSDKLAAILSPAERDASPR